MPILDPRRSSHLAGQLACLRTIHSTLNPQVPLLQTIFNPLAQARNLAGGETLIAHLHRYPQAVMKGLATIAETTRRFIAAVVEIGIDGIFYAIQHAQAGLLDLDEYRTFGLPADQIALEPAKHLWCNLLHLHGSRIHFELVQDYASLFSIVNWHDRETPPSLTEAQQRIKRAVCGGVSQNTIVFGDSQQVRDEALDALAQTKGRRFILGTGCVVPVIAPHGNISLVAQIAHLNKTG